MLTALADEESTCTCRASDTPGRLLITAQESGHIHSDVDGTRLFALVNAVGWIAEQTPQLADRRDHLFALVMDGLAANRGWPATVGADRPW
jgi:hypothetical protein